MQNYNENRKLQRKQKKEKGICRDCTNAVEIGKSFCKICNHKFKIKRDKRKTLGLCWCGKLSGNHTQCASCLKKSAESYTKKRERLLSQGICTRCGKEKHIQAQDRPRQAKIQFCTTCVLKSKSEEFWSTSKRWTELFDIFQKQQGICPYSGLKITIGIDAQIDHIMPRSMGGINNIENLQWTHYWVNMMKFNKTNEEFIEMIKRIYEKFNPKNSGQAT